MPRSRAATGASLFPGGRRGVARGRWRARQSTAAGAWERPVPPRPGITHCSIGCGSLSCASITPSPWSLSVETEMRRGFAFSLTGMVTESTPLR